MVELVIVNSAENGLGYDSGNLAEWLKEQGHEVGFTNWFRDNNIEGVNNVAEIRGGYFWRKSDVDAYFAQL
jgi:hypothetical protein